MKKIQSLFIILLIVLVTGCSNSKSESSLLDVGKVENYKYINDSLGLSFKIPESWNVIDEKTINLLTTSGLNFLASDNDELSKNLKKSENSNLNLIYIYKYPIDHIDGFNPKFMCSITDISNLNNIKTAKDFLEAQTLTLKQTNIPYKFSDISTVEIENKTFTYMYYLKS